MAIYNTIRFFLNRFWACKFNYKGNVLYYYKYSKGQNSIYSDSCQICKASNRQKLKKKLSKWLIEIVKKSSVKINNQNVFLFYGNYHPIWSNDVSISSQDNVLSESHHSFHCFNKSLLLWTDKLDKIWKSRTYQVYLVKPHSILSLIYKSNKV